MLFRSRKQRDLHLFKQPFGMTNPPKHNTYFPWGTAYFPYGNTYWL